MINKNNMNILFNDTFFVMFFPLFNIEVPTLENKIIEDDLDIDVLKNYINNNQAVIIEIAELGTFVFTNLCDIMIEKLQKKYKKYVNYIFGANDENWGYFKKLVDGKIYRKISSDGRMILNNQLVTSCPDVRGQVCEYEQSKNTIYKINYKAKYLANMLENFDKKIILDMFDYYVGLEKFTIGNINKIKTYKIEW